MLYLLAIVLPPVAILLCGKPAQFGLNCILCLFGLLPGIIHAVLVVNAYLADKRNDKLIRAMKRK